jgi:hypothetical protein
MPVIGFLGSGWLATEADFVAAFRRGLKETSFVENQNVKIEFRWPEGQYERLPGMVADLIQRRVSVLERVGALGGADENDAEWQARIGWSFALENSTNVDAAERSTLFCRQRSVT